MRQAPRGFLLLAEGNWKDLYRIEETARERGTITEVLPSSLLSGLGHAICLLSLGEGGLNALGLIKPGATVGTARRRANVSDLWWPERTVDLQTLHDAVPARVRRHLLPGPITPATWVAVRAAIVELVPGAAEALERLDRRATRRAPVALSDKSRLTLAEEKDSVSLALSLAGFPHQQISRLAPTSGTTSFLDGLQDVNLSEDQAIQVDVGVMPGWYRGLPDPRGIVSFWREGGGSLTVMNVNRTSIEGALGVDLVYYDESADRFVLVQYKRLRPQPSKTGKVRPATYRPDANLSKELANMRKVDALIDPATGAHDFRLHAGACYLKLCPPSASAPFSEGLLKGMYLPLEYFDLLWDDPKIRGPKGGRRFSYESVGRYLNNTDFVALFNGGWIGSRGATSKTLRGIIRELVAADHSVVLAVAGS